MPFMSPPTPAPGKEFDVAEVLRTLLRTPPQPVEERIKLLVNREIAHEGDPRCPTICYRTHWPRCVPNSD